MNDPGTRLRELRQLHGMTQTEFAAKLDVKQSLLSDVERGRRPAATLVTKAAWVFHTGPGFFAEDPTSYAVGSLNYRTRKLSAKVQEAANRTFGELEREARRELESYRMIDLTARELGDRSDPLPVEQINATAAKARSLLRIPDAGPVPNVTRALEYAGVPVLELANPFVDLSQIDGVSSPDTLTARGVVAVTPTDAGDRARFTRAHELGHLVLHTDERPTTESVREGEANLFAGAFLLPDQDAHELITPSLTLEGYAQIKAKYAMSVAAIIRRAHDLRIIDAARYRTLNIQIGSRGWRKKEPVAVPVEKTSLLSQMKVSALQDRQVANSETVDYPSTASIVPEKPADVVSLFPR